MRCSFSWLVSLWAMYEPFASLHSYVRTASTEPLWCSLSSLEIQCFFYKELQKAGLEDMQRCPADSVLESPSLMRVGTILLPKCKTTCLFLEWWQGEVPAALVKQQLKYCPSEPRIWLGCHVHCVIFNRGQRAALCSCHKHLGELQTLKAASALVKWGLVVSSGGSSSRWVCANAQGDVSGWG